MILPFSSLLILRFFKVGQNIIKTPARVSELLPMIKIILVPPHIDHSVYRARTPYYFSTRCRNLRFHPPFASFCFQHPVNCWVTEIFPVSDRNMYPRVGILRACLNQQHFIGCRVGQPIRQNTSSTTASNNNKIYLRYILPHLPIFPIIKYLILIYTTRQTIYHQHR